MKVTVNIEYNSDDPEDLAKAKNMIESSRYYDMLFDIKHNMRGRWKHQAEDMTGAELLELIFEEIYQNTEGI